MALGEAIEFANVGDRPIIVRTERVLCGSRCLRCEGTTWPASAVCPVCLDATTTLARFGPDGVLVSCVEVWVPLAGLAVPYVLGEVELVDGPPVIAHIRGIASDTPLPMSVSVVAADDENAIPPFWFEPKSDEG